MSQRQSPNTKPTLEPVRGIPEMWSSRRVCLALDISPRTLRRRPYRYVQEKPGGARRYFAEDIRMSLLLNTVVPEKKK